jgi:hypothetical protein
MEVPPVKNFDIQEREKTQANKDAFNLIHSESVSQVSDRGDGFERN